MCNEGGSCFGSVLLETGYVFWQASFVACLWNNWLKKNLRIFLGISRPGRKLGARHILMLPFEYAYIPHTISLFIFSNHQQLGPVCYVSFLFFFVFLVLAGLFIWSSMYFGSS